MIARWLRLLFGFGAPSDRPLNLGVGSAALVYDNSFFGATSPIFGQRYRLEVSPTVGSLNYIGVLGDYRKYLMPARPFTLAARLLHYGRYGKDGEDPRPQPLFLGYPGLVRSGREPDLAPLCFYESCAIHLELLTALPPYRLTALPPSFTYAPLPRPPSSSRS